MAESKSIRFNLFVERSLDVKLQKIAEAVNVKHNKEVHGLAGVSSEPYTPHDVARAMMVYCNHDISEKTLAAGIYKHIRA